MNNKLDSLQINAKPLTKELFIKFGDVLETKGNTSFEINKGMCERFDKLSKVDFDIADGEVVLSIFRSKPYPLPFRLRLLERHPLGSQSFMPLHSDPFLVIVAENFNNTPGEPKVFVTNGKQGVNFFKNTWHGVLTPIHNECDFFVVDRSGPTQNLVEFHLDKTILISYQS